MRVWFSGPRILGGFIRPGVSFGPSDFRRARRSTGTAAPSIDYVYVIAGEHNLVKIGVSNDPTARIATLQTASPYRLRLVFTAPAYGNAFNIEQEAHSILAAHRASGEWFSVTPDMAIAALFGAADRIGCSLSQPILQSGEPLGRWKSLPGYVRVLILSAIITPICAFLVPAEYTLIFLLVWMVAAAILCA